ncbi:TRAP transporter permease [Aestuariispira insulae]|uniref:TRAP transporter 4TM/12TM fusion protein n=1 Tax=Aestuariispira insulae TaxID=1461337 RepID=A0A3D9HI54_9PROT|nr:TRAP transporter permease [Aestuariispira insulae]RED49160.1 TRAP transporter 4TM/12TM fusion protein [Aestuariispira insulae]
MSEQNNPSTQLSNDELEDLVASTDTGGRQPTNQAVVKLMAGVALFWSLLQIWYSAPFSYALGVGVFNSGEMRSIHLAIAIGLAFMAYPAFKMSPRRRIPLADWVLAIMGALCAFYLFLFNTEFVGSIVGTRLSDRPNAANTMDVIVACVGILLLLEATRRALGPPLMVVAMIFLAYTFLGPHAPGILAWKGASFDSVAYHQWISTEGVFGIALGVSTDLVFLFVLFGALLDKAGAGNYFIKVAFSLMGHLRGGPAKAAVVASGMTGLISGSSIANVVTTGTFTIPMMKRVGFSREKSGAVEVASSVNGQIMPPVMGAAAFLMVEYVNIPYFDVVKHAFIPAVISYIALVYIVHLEAMKKGMEGLPRAGEPKPAKWAAISFLMSATGILALAGGVYWIMEAWLALESNIARLLAVVGIVAVQLILKTVYFNKAGEDVKMKVISTFALVLGNAVVISFGIAFLLDLIRTHLGGTATPYVVGMLLIATYVWLASRCAKEPDLEVDDPNSPIISLPEPGPTIRSGLHFLLPVGVLIWCLMVERLSPSLSAFWAVALMIFILLTQKHLFAMFRGESTVGKLEESFRDLIDGMISGARNMIGIGIATAAAGIIVGAVSQTGVGSVFVDIVEIISMGQIMLILIFTAILSLILGMGLPTTANYIVVSSLLAPVIVELGLENGLIVPLIAVHLFVFYFGIMADVTPPVGLASFAAAAVSGGDPIRTGFVAFFYSLRTALLPFLFIFNTDLLLIDVTPMEGVIVFIVATAAMLLFTAGSQGYFFARSKLWESLALILIAFTLFRPGFWMDIAVPPYEEQAPAQVFQAAENLPEGAEMRLIVEGLDDVGDVRVFTAIVNLGPAGSGQDRLFDFGLELLENGDEVIVDNATYDSPAQNAGFDFDQKILTVLVPAAQPAKELFYIPALLLLGLIILLQRRRMQAQGLNAATA